MYELHFLFWTHCLSAIGKLPCGITANKPHPGKTCPTCINLLGGFWWMLWTIIRFPWRVCLQLCDAGDCFGHVPRPKHWVNSCLLWVDHGWRFRFLFWWLRSYRKSCRIADPQMCWHVTKRRSFLGAGPDTDSCLFQDVWWLGLLFLVIFNKFGHASKDRDFMRFQGWEKQSVMMRDAFEIVENEGRRTNFTHFRQYRMNRTSTLDNLCLWQCQLSIIILEDLLYYMGQSKPRIVRTFGCKLLCSRSWTSGLDSAMWPQAHVGWNGRLCLWHMHICTSTLGMKK